MSRQNRELRLFSSREAIDELIKVSVTGDYSRASKITEKWFCLEDLVKLKWQSLESIHDRIVKTQTSSIMSVSTSRSDHFE